MMAPGSWVRRRGIIQLLCMRRDAAFLIMALLLATPCKRPEINPFLNRSVSKTVWIPTLMPALMGGVGRRMDGVVRRLEGALPLSPLLPHFLSIASRSTPLLTLLYSTKPLSTK